LEVLIVGFLFSSTELIVDQLAPGLLISLELCATPSLSACDEALTRIPEVRISSRDNVGLRNQVRAAS